MASNTVTDRTENAVTPRGDDGVRPLIQTMAPVENRLVTLSDKIILCNRLLNDLKDLSDVLVKKSLQDVSLPLQK